MPSTLRQKRLQALRETNYHEFKMWLNVYVRMAESPEPREFGVDGVVAIDMMRRRKWRDLVTTFPYLWSRPDHGLKLLRELIYHDYDCEGG